MKHAPAKGESDRMRKVPRSELCLDRPTVSDHSVLRLDQLFSGFLRRETFCGRMQHFQFWRRERLSFQPSRLQH
jgi:hypothetical protein